MLVCRDRQTQRPKPWLKETWNTIRMHVAITTDIITMVIVDMITVQITTAMETDQ
jgi:hypothetical protein